LKYPAPLSVTDRFQVVKPIYAEARKTEKGRAMLLWPETGPEGKWWYARWSDEPAAKKIIGRSCRDAIHNCVGNVETAIVWDEEVIAHQKQEFQHKEMEAVMRKIRDSEVHFFHTALAAQQILTPAHEENNETEISQGVEEPRRSAELQFAKPQLIEPQSIQPQSIQPPRKTILAWVETAWSWALKQLGSNPTKKRLRVCETVSLGEKRFVAVIEADGEQFLVGGAATSVATLARLQPTQEFSDVLQGRLSQNPVQA
jgi:hypothetical protein